MERRKNLNMPKDLDEQLEQALENVNEDRDVTKRLLNDRLTTFQYLTNATLEQKHRRWNVAALKRAGS